MATVGGGEEMLYSPKNRVKFLCSHGGKILLRPGDGHLKYVGGETRIVAVPRDIDFSGIMKKLLSLSDGDMVLKYQLIPDDLDTLVSVRSEEDLHHMFDENDRLNAKSFENGGTPRLRTFLFPSNPILIENQTASNTMDTYTLEQRYIDAINGVVRTPTFSISSSGSSPKSTPPNGYINIDTINQDTFISNGHQNSNIREIQRVYSSPSLYCLSHHHHHYHHHLHPSDQQLRYQSPGLRTGLSIRRNDIGKCQVGYTPTPYYPPTRPHSGTSGCIACGRVEECRSLEDWR